MHLLGIDTGGTYTDAAVLDGAASRVLGHAKALTSRPDLSVGVAQAIDAALASAGVGAAEIGLVSLSTTLATNALVEGQGGRVALVAIGLDAGELSRAGLADAMAGDPVIPVAGGHDHAGHETSPLDLDALAEALARHDGLTGVAVAARFATRNPAHELAAAARIAETTGLPVTCSHQLSAGLGGPRRALTAVLNARLIGLIAGLVDATEAHLYAIGTPARLMVVRGDGALVPAGLARARPIETILSGPAASVAGAGWLTGVTEAMVSDIGGTTTDVCLLRDGRPRLDPQGATVGGFRTLVEAVAMRTWGLGGDSAVHVADGLEGQVTLGPRRLLPVSMLAVRHPDLVHPALDAHLALDGPPLDGGGFVVPLWDRLPEALDLRERAVAERLMQGPLRMGEAVQTRMERPALDRLVRRGFCQVAGVTPSDAAHVAGLADHWDAAAAEKALTLMSRRRAGDGRRVAPDARTLARAIVDRLAEQTVDCLLQAAFADDSRGWDGAPEALARHPLTRAGLDARSGLIETRLRLGVPVVGLGASAAAYYPSVGARLGTRMIVPEHAGIANAIGAVVGQVSHHADGSVTAPAPGRFLAHGPGEPEAYGDADTALAALTARLEADARARAAVSGVAEPQITVAVDRRDVPLDGTPTFVSATVRVTAHGRPRLTRD